MLSETLRSEPPVIHTVAPAGAMSGLDTSPSGKSIWVTMTPVASSTSTQTGSASRQVYGIVVRAPRHG